LTHSETGEKLSVSLEHAFESNSGELIVEIARKGCGIALMPRYLVSDDLRHGNLVPLLTSWSAPELWLTAYYPPYEKIPAKVAVLTSAVEDLVTSEPDLPT